MKRKPIVCIGASLVDESYSCLKPPLQGTSNPSTYFRSAGGVARNIAHHLALLGNEVELITHFGNDPEGDWLINQCKYAGIGLKHSLMNEVATGRFVALLSPEGDLFTGAVSCRFENLITPDFLQQNSILLKSASLVLMDTNLNAGSLDWLLGFSRAENIPCIIEPVSVPKAARLQKADLNNVLLMTPNRDEIIALNGDPGNGETQEMIRRVLDRGVQYLWMRDGKNGSGLYSKESAFQLPAPRVQVVDTTGAGDAALAGWMHAWLMNKSPEECVRYGHAMASLILQEKGAIKQNLNSLMLESVITNQFRIDKVSALKIK